MLVEKSEIYAGIIEAPPSKSYTHRAYAIAALAEGDSKIINPLFSGDTNATLSACKAFGIHAERSKNSIMIKGCAGKLKKPAKEIDVENSGTTLRLFTAIASLDEKATLTGDDSIKQRPMQPLLDALNSLGARCISFNEGRAPVVVEGKLKGGKAELPGTISSQFVSAVLIASPYAEKEVELRIKGALVSRPYVDITIDMMQNFGASVQNKGYENFLIENSIYKAREYKIEGDYSSASYFLALAAIKNTKITIKNLRKDSMQGDKKIVEILKDMGADVKQKSEEIIMNGAKKLEGIEVNLKDAPDLLPTIAALACKAKGETVINGVAHARFKETDRIAACAEEFRKFGAEIEEKEDGLVIKGSKNLKGAKVDAYKDHRMAMALSILALDAEGETEINDAESVKISFSEFFDILKGLGARMKK